MDLSPKKTCQPAYPDTRSFVSVNREFLAILASLGIGAAAYAGPMAEGVKPETACREVVKIPLDKVEPTVKALGLKLNDDAYKVRRASTLKLIQIGRGTYSEPKDKGKAKAIVLANIEVLLKHKDPEVRTRALKIQAALKPKVVTPQHPRVKGRIAPVRMLGKPAAQ